MKVHFYRVRPNAYGGFNTGTLCGRLSNQSPDGNNSTDKREEVTCLLCLARLAAKPTPTEGARR